MGACGRHRLRIEETSALRLREAPLFTRRTSLQLAIGAAAIVPASRLAFADAAAEGPEVHGLSTFGDLALPKDFAHLAYVDPKAPKGGEIVLQITGTSGNQNFETFNTLNIFTLRGDGAAGMALCFDTLMTGNADEPDALYGLVARAVRVSPDKNTYRFLLRKEAKFWDGTPLTAADVVFSIKTLADKTKSHPVYWITLGHDLDNVKADGEDVIVTLKPDHSREAILNIAGLPIFSAAFYAKVAFDEVSLVPPLGSSAYKVGTFQQGRFITFERVPDYWAKDLPINVGTNNFGTIRFEYYADRKVAFEGFKAGDYTFHEEFTSAIWAKGYDFPAVTDGRIKKEFFADASPNGTQGWFINTRREKFKDPRVRQALGYTFDFKWTDANIMYDAYKRTTSYFQNSPMMAMGAPSPDELKILEPFRDKLPPDVFGPVYMPPEGDGSGSDRGQLRQAFKLLTDAGCKRSGEMLVLPDGKPLDIEFLDSTPVMQPHTLPFIRNLKMLGIDASLRVVDPAQYRRRTDNFDFDIIVENFSFGLTPGVGMRDVLGSEAAKIPGSRNRSGIADPVVDALVDKAIVAPDRESLTILCRCIDRVLRAGHYWVPMWNKAGHTVAFWDLFGWPQTPAKYGLNVLPTWWYDETKAKKTDLKPR